MSISGKGFLKEDYEVEFIMFSRLCLYVVATDMEGSVGHEDRSILD